MTLIEDCADTIVAPLTAPGVSAVAVVRVSGVGVPHVAERIVVKCADVLANPRRAIYSEVRDTLTDAPHPVLDDAIIIYFAAPASFTGEDSLEISIHGSPFILDRLLKNILTCGARLAEPGEFSKRALLNGRLDLAQVEAVADLINSESAAQAKTARLQLDGQLSNAISDLGEPLRDLLSEIEAHIDFPEDDIEPQTTSGWQQTLQAVNGKLARYLATFATGRLLREGARVALVGIPNAGKSSLLNRLVGEDRAIVTAIPGTTRDVIEEHIALDGVKIVLSDTAGIAPEGAFDRELDEVEKLGVERSWKTLGQADVMLFVADLSVSMEAQLELYDAVKDRVKSSIVVGNKRDLFTTLEQQARREALAEQFGKDALLISAQKNEGIEDLRNALRQTIFGDKVQGIHGDSLMVSNIRHFEALSSAKDTVTRALTAISEGEPAEVIALEVRLALGYLNDIIGVTHNEDILGRIFAKFCIGK